MRRYLFVCFIAMGLTALHPSGAQNLSDECNPESEIRKLRSILSGKDSWEKCLGGNDISDINESTVLDPSNCDELVVFPLYCETEIATSKISIGLNTDALKNRNATLYLSVEIPRTSQKKIDLMIAEAEVRTSLRSEERIGRLTCSNTPDGTSKCVQDVSFERFCEITKKVNLDSAVQSIMVRNSRKQDICLGKISTNESLLNAVPRVDRQYCTFTPADGNSSINGSGFFDAKGYGLQGDSQFYMAMEGLPANQTVRGCSAFGERYKEVLSFTSYGPEATDSIIYRQASPEEQALIQNDPLEYSYDLFRTLQAESGQIATRSRTLAQINRQVSPAAASSKIRESNKDLKKLKRKRRNKREKANNNASRKTRLASIRASNPRPQSALAWLAFDPLAGGSVVLAPQCSTKSIGSKAYGTITCNATPSDQQRCSQMTSSFSANREGRVCFETRSGYNLMLTRASGLDVGIYYLCLNGNPLSSSPLIVATDALGNFGELRVTDSTTAAAATPGLALGSPQANLSGVGLFSNGDCSGTAVLQAP